MSWSSKTLADTMPAIAAGAQKTVNAVQKEINALNAAIARLNNELMAAQERANAADELVNSMTGSAAESGIYQLNLAPDTGIWSDRILNATGAPPRNPSAYSAIICTLTLAGDIGAAANIKNTIKQAVSKPLPPIPERIKIPGLKPPAKPTPPSLPEPEPIPDNAWKSATVADLFPGTRTAVLGSAAGVKAEADKLSGGITELNEKKAALQDSLNEAQALLTNLTESGVYSFTAIPELSPSADWFDRMIAPSEESGRPPFNPDLYSSGSVTVILATSYLQLVQRFTKFQKALNTPLG